MKRICLIVAVLFSALAVRADDFADKVDVSPLEKVTVQYRQTLKTLDSFSREVLGQITGRSTFQGEKPTFTLLDMSFRPEQYTKANIIKIRHVPLREDLRQLDSISPDEADRIVKQGKVSYEFLYAVPTRTLMEKIMSTAVTKAGAVQEVYGSVSMMDALFAPNTPVLRIIPPATNNADDHIWHNLDEIGGWIEKLKVSKDDPGAKPLLAYGENRIPLLGDACADLLRLRDAWEKGDADEVNKNIVALAASLPKINPEAYPSEAKRSVEVTYNKLAKLTIPGAAFYFIAFVLFLMTAIASASHLRIWALRVFMIGLLVHTAGIAIRWWLVATQAGNWFEGIPIKNQFESVMFSAWFGCVVGLILELRKPRGFFGAAASFVGWMSLIALFAAPYIAGRDIGGNIEQVQGVLMSYWLYIHVVLVTASYALITMGFLLSAWWLFKYYKEYGTLSRESGYRVSSDNASFDGAIEGGAMALTVGQSLARMLFIPIARPQAAAAKKVVKEGTTHFLATLDLCNLVVLQLAFWVLGCGIITGAIWADQSWGRPWGWDPKETFALVTWIVYLIVVHVRVATEHKAWWTAVLSIIGFAIMLFNWIGVNFFLVGLHSYA
jgi:cytochrome c-type biogenesis protein CcsB